MTTCRVCVNEKLVEQAKLKGGKRLEIFLHRAFKIDASTQNLSREFSKKEGTIMIGTSYYAFVRMIPFPEIEPTEHMYIHTFGLYSLLNRGNFYDST
jgi:hypothetical protein|eukprot:CAMPEP_0202508110 /NCGR_PEP_ID=MMETSP1361-20130828/52080_1 /ASSEMBLY_ACC=CAM_ASM_000849 /TAXON_ID=210615 /ORGANISM="Staurosira complex sp., Strain CCMP2646" /LENGTH=96 /DNA_ID=CAMNT_0049142271 /DNA_START=579 /DNA_END=869 /DNA_ORIENTATION=+